MSPRIVATLQAEDAASRLREEAAHAFRADVTDRHLYVAQVKPLEVAHRLGVDDHTRCGRLVWLFEQIESAKAVEFVMQPCGSCAFEEHR